MLSTAPTSEDSASGIEERGLDGYGSVQAALSAQVSSDEAEQARVLARNSIRALLVCATLIVLLGALFAIADLPPLVQALAAGGVPIALGMALVTHWRVPYGARLILTLAALLAPSHGDLLTGTYLGSALFGKAPTLTETLTLTSRLCLAWLIGSAMDRGARSAESRRARRRWRVWLIALASLLLITWYVQWSMTRAWSTYIGVENVLRATLLVAWTTWGHDRWVDPVRYGPQDVGIVFRAGITRWRRRLTGRMLATVSAAVIMIAVLNGFALPSALRSDGPDPAVHAEVMDFDSPEIGDGVFMWPRLGRLLRESDFSNENFRFYFVDTNDADLLKTLGELGTTAEGRRVGQRYGEQLLERLAPWRITSAAAFASAIGNHPQRSSYSGRIWLIERQPTGKQAPLELSSLARQYPEWFGVDAWIYLCESLSDRLTPWTLQTLHQYLEVRAAMMLGASIFVCLAFVTLWRRGGDFAGAKWIGLWFAGIAMSFAFPIVDLVFDSTFLRAAHMVGGQQWQSTVSSVIRLFYAFSISLGFLSMLGFPLWLAYRHLRPPPAPSSTPFRSRLRDKLLYADTVWMAGTMVSAASAMGLRSLGLSRTAVAAVAGITAFLGIAAIEWLREHRSYPRSPVDPRLRLGKGPLAMLTAAQALLVLSFYLRDGRLISSPTGWGWATSAGLMAFALATTLYMLRSNWLRVSGGRDLSWLITAFLMPLGFEAVNGTLPDMLDAIGIFLPGAASVASLFVVVALMQPIQHGIESLFETISTRALRRIQRRIDLLLDDALSDPLKSDLGPQVEHLFSELGVSGYALWIRQGRFTFAPQIDRLNAAPEAMTLSEPLCARLAQSDVVIDLEGVHSEWQYFFDQFELYRLAVHTRSRYLYRVRYGSSLGGLLLLGDSAAALGLAHDGFTETASALGLALSRWRNSGERRDL